MRCLRIPRSGTAAPDLLDPLHESPEEQLEDQRHHLPIEGALVMAVLNVYFGCPDPEAHNLEKVMAELEKQRTRAEDLQVLIRKINAEITERSRPKSGDV